MLSPADLIYLDSMDQLARKFWSFQVERVIKGLGADPGGLTFEEARRRLARYGRNHLKLRKRASALKLLLAQFKSPLIIILLLAAILSFFLGETVDAMIIAGIALLSGLLGFGRRRRRRTPWRSCSPSFRSKRKPCEAGLGWRLRSRRLCPATSCFLMRATSSPVIA